LFYFEKMSLLRKLMAGCISSWLQEIGLKLYRPIYHGGFHYFSNKMVISVAIMNGKDLIAVYENN